jgi:hypothetical protein
VRIFQALRLSTLGYALEYYWYAVTPSRPIVFILGAMRSGTTLLKALLGEAGDVSHLSEIKLRSYRTEDRFTVYHRFRQLSDKRITVLKDPAPYRYLEEYPHISIARSKVLIAARDIHGVIPSLQKMNRQTRMRYRENQIADLVDYWCRAYERVLNVTAAMSPDTVKIVKYEELTNNPRETMSAVFQFVGSKKREGVSEYGLPETGEWKWGTDDGGETIRTRSVQARVSPVVDELTHFLDDRRVQKVRQWLGYRD